MVDTPIDQASLGRVISYHDQTKHQPGRPARGPGSLDYSTRPKPFRRFSGTSAIALPEITKDRTPPYPCLYQYDSVKSQPFGLELISSILHYSIAINHRAQYQDSKWSLRACPSAGGVYPLETYLITGPIENVGKRGALYHYAADKHAIERRAEFDDAGLAELHEDLPESAILVAITSVSWRAMWKFGERAWRYEQLDTGHQLAAMNLAAAMFGWRAAIVPQLHDTQIAALTGIDRTDEFHPAERESPQVALVLYPGDQPFDPLFYEPPKVVPKRWYGQANRLGSRHANWPVIDEVRGACNRDENWQDLSPKPLGASIQPEFTSANDSYEYTAGELIQRRRSSMGMSSRVPLTAEAFFAMLARLMPWMTTRPWDMVHWPAMVHLGVFVHNVEGLKAGLYVAARDRLGRGMLRQAMRNAEDFEWAAAEDCPPQLPLMRLTAANARDVARQVTANQPAAAQGAFSVVMLSQFESTLYDYGPAFYRLMHYEAGMIGHILHLEAEAAGLAGLGMGNFFDDAVHELFGVADRELQDLYHYAVGTRSEDPMQSKVPPSERSSS